MLKLKLIFCGSRNWQDRHYIILVMSRLKSNLGEFIVIEGEAEGADKQSREAAENVCALPVEPYPANWTKFGKAAGPMRNTQMRVEGRADGVIAFHNDLKSSRGTKNMVEQSLKAGLPVWTSQQSDEALMQFILQLRRKACLLQQ